MAEAFIAKEDRHKNIAEGFVAVDGRWRHVSEAFVANDSQWKSAWSGEPDVNSLTWDRSGSAPWTRLVAGYSVTGLWSSLTITMVWYNGTRTILASHGPQTMTGTVAQSGIETQVLTPNANYRLEIEWVSLSGTYKVIGYRDQTTVAPPVATGFWSHGVSHNAGGLAWNSFRDVSDWHTLRNNDGKAWHHGGDYPSFHEGGLAASSTYYYQTQCATGGVWGGMSAQQYFTTAPAPYTPGEFQFWPNGNSQTWQSSGADWQGNSRTWWYHANGSQWSSTRGNQLTCIYYNMGGYWEYDNVMAAIANGGQITRTRVYVHRAQEDAGLYGPVQSLVALNGAHFSNNPWNVSGNQGGPALEKGQGAWVDVPAHWGRHLFEAPGSYTGWILGDSSNSNNYMALGKNNYSTGNMLINIS